MKYSRKLFRFNSRQARAHIVRDATGYPLLDKFNGKFIHYGDKWDAEHIIDLKTAWGQGFLKQYKHDPEKALERMREFANDANNLIPVSMSSNRSRGTKSLWEWAPLNLAFVPERNAIIRGLCEKYELVLTKRQLWAMDYADKKIAKHKYGIHLGKFRGWLITNGFHRWLMPF